MRPETKSYFLKEYGSWSVLIVSFITGLAVSRGFSWLAILLVLALGLLINSKQAYTLSVRRGDKTATASFLGHLGVAAAILVLIFGSDLFSLLWLLIFPTAYLLMNRLAGEHFVLTEVLGFMLISLAAVLAKFLITGGIDIRLFVATAVYFSAGVFKVKALLRKRKQDRILSALYVIFAAFMYKGFHIPLIILLPLLDNLLVAIRPYYVKLKTTGWIEVAKSLLFLALMLAFY
jgi:hypothetical protein